MPLVEQELITLPDHPSSPPLFSGVRVNRSLVLCVLFCRSLFVVCSFSFGHCVVCPSIYGCWLPSGIFNLFSLFLESKLLNAVGLCLAGIFVLAWLLNRAIILNSVLFFFLLISIIHYRVSVSPTTEQICMDIYPL